MDPAAKQATRERIAIPARGGHDDPAHDPRAGRRRASRRSRRGARPRADRRRGHAGRADRGRARHASGSGSIASLDPADVGALAASLGAGAEVVPSGAGASYEVRGLAAAPDPRLVAALAAWCEARGLLLTELRLGAASLEERYLELVGGGATAIADPTREHASSRRGRWVPARPPRRRPGRAWRWRWRAYELRLVLRRGESLLVTFVIPAGVLLVFSAFDPAGGSAAAPRWIACCPARSRWR